MADTAPNDALIVFTPSGKRGRFPIGTPVLQAARSLGVDIDSVCGGRAICGRCQITIGEGEFAKHGIKSTAAHLSEFSAVEKRYDDKRGLLSGRDGKHASREPQAAAVAAEQVAAERHAITHDRVVAIEVD